MAGRKKAAPTEKASRPEVIEFVASVANDASPDYRALAARRPSTLNDIVAVLRNGANPIHERAVAARALGLLMNRDVELRQRMKMDADILIDSLLQIVHYCCHAKTKSSECRKMHVNSCLVISMVMDAPRDGHAAIDNVVAIDSDLLKLTRPPPVKPTTRERSKPTLAARFPTSPNARHSTTAPSPNQLDVESPPRTSTKPSASRISRKRSLPSPVAPSSPIAPHCNALDLVFRPPTTTQQRSAHSGTRPVSMKSVLFGDEGHVMGLTPTGDNLPVYEFNAAFSGYGVPTVYYPFHRPDTTAATNTAPPSYASRDLMRATTISKPSRAIKGSNQTHALPVTPHIIYPSKLYRDSLESVHRMRPFVMPPDYMLDMLETNHMPLSLPFSRHSTRRADSADSRIQPTPWGEVNRVVLGSSFAAYHQLQSIAHDPSLPTGSSNQLVAYSNARCVIDGRNEENSDNNLDINSAEYKRRRLLAILHAPIDSTATMQALALNEHSTIMRGFSLSLHQLHDEERAIMTKMSATILHQRNQLPLKFLFELPGGIGYCRDRLQTSMGLWVEEFEVNQQRAAWLQWKALVEQFRFKDRMGDFVRQAALKRMRLAMDLMVKAFVHKGWVKWVFTTQIDIWHHRDKHVRKIQPQVRRHFAMRAFLAAHDAKPVGGRFRDMFLAPPRSDLPYQIPLRVRLERRQLWFAAIAVQAPYRGRQFRKFMRQQRIAATKIQAASRRRQARLKYLAARFNIIHLQAHIRRHLARKAFVRLRDATTMVQRNLRGRAARKFVRLVVLATRRQGELRWQAILPLLRMARGYQGRQQARAIRAYHANRLRSALLIQKAWYTYNNEWTTFLLLGCLREREVDEKKWARDLYVLHLHQSATRIQTVFRSFVANQRNVMALRIQQACRSHVARQVLARLKARVVAHRRIKWWFRAHHARRNRLATRIQYWWRKAVSGRMLRHLAHVAATIQALDERRTRLREYNAATTIQAIVHGVWTRFRFKKTKSAIVIQRNERRRQAQKLATKLRFERRICIATAFLEAVKHHAVYRELERRKLRYRTCATTIQRIYRGQTTRQKLAEHWRWLDERTRMAQRVQRLWRQTADKRFALRLLALQRRRVANPFKTMESLSDVIGSAIEKSLAYCDPYDPLVGLTLIGWLRRLGLDDFYDVLQQHGYTTVASLASVTEDFLQSTCQIKDKDITQLFLTGIRYREWLSDVAEQRRVVQKLEKAAARHDKPYQVARKAVTDQHAVVMRWRHKLDKAQADAADFAHPPKAVRRKLERAQFTLARAEQALAECERIKADKESVAAAAKDAWTHAKAALKPMEANEIKAVFLRQAAAPVDSNEQIKALFLDYFPNMEFRAVRFVESLHEKPVTLAQLLRFFGRFTTISDIKFHTPALLRSSHDGEIAAHDHKRWLECTDVLQYGVERAGDILHIPVLGMIDPRQAPTDLSSVAAIVRGMQQARTLPLPARPLELRTCLADLMLMETSAARVQHLWRTRQGRRMVAALREQQHRTHLAEAYAAERNRQNVRRVWENDVKKAQAMLQARLDDAKHAAVVAELSMTLRFGYSQEWHDDYQAWYYNHTTTGDVVWERPSYNESDLTAAKILQRLVRRFLGKCRRAAYKRSLTRWAKYEREKVVWEAQWMDRKRCVTLRVRDINATTRAAVLEWRRGGSTSIRLPSNGGDALTTMHSPALVDVLTAWTTLLQQAYHKSVRKEHMAHMLLPVYARPPNANATALIASLHLYAKLRDAVRPTGAAALTIQYTKVEMPFGWTEVPQDPVYYLHEASGAVTWDQPEYTFDEEYAARKLQSAYRMLQGRKAFKRMLDTFSFVELLHASIKHGTGIGWIGFGLEGMSLLAYLGRLGLAKQIPSIAKTHLTMDSFWSVPDAKWLNHGIVWQKEEKALLHTAPQVIQGSRRLAPLTSRMSVLPHKHGFHIIPSEKALQQLLSAHFTGQQGRVQSIVRAFKGLPFPVSYNQLDVYLRGYTGRPAQAAENILDIVPPGSTSLESEVDLYKLYRHALRRCAIVASNLKLERLAKRLHHVLDISTCIHGVACDLKLALAATPLTPDDKSWVCRDLPCVKGLWESNIDKSGKLSVAQAALWLRQEGLEYMLQYIRATVTMQSTYRMHARRKWYVAVIAHRNSCALTIQLAWRCSLARAVRSHLVAEQTSSYEQHYVEASQLFFFIHVPTQERINVHPIDDLGHPIVYRPMVLDRITRKYILAWPWLASSNQAPETAASVFESNVVCSICDNERASRICDVCCTSRGDYIYYCFACYCTAHPPALAWHTYQPLNRLHAQALRCVECTRLSSHRCLGCNEDYCDRCLARVHSKGKRASHLIEHYEPKSQVCIECEQRVALKTCTVCADALCEDCASRTHARGNKAKHVMHPILQLLPPGSEHCTQCKSRVADRTCRHCARPVCHVCLETAHPIHCLDSQLEAAKRALLGDNVCVDCGKPADRVCQTCGDKYCSVRWMGNPGCFERFHAKGKRIEHEATPFVLPPLVLTPEALALEKKVAAQKHAMQVAAEAAAKVQEAADMEVRRQFEREQKAYAAEVQRAKRALALQVPQQPLPESNTTILSTPEKRTVAFRKPKKEAPRCTTLGCTNEALRQIPFCADHCTAQNLLALGHDAKDAAKIMAGLERIKQRRAHEAEFGVSLLEKVRREFKDMAFLNDK